MAERHNDALGADWSAQPVVRTGAWISEAWDIVQSEFWVFLGAGLVLSLAGSIIYVTTALICGLIALAFQRARGAARVDLDAVGRCFHPDIGLPAFLASLVQSALMAVPAIPIAIITIPLFIALVAGRHVAPAIGALIGAGALCIACTFIMSVMWMFTYPIITDRRCGFWQAMELSRGTVFRDILGFSGFAIALGLIQLIGLALCGIGLLVTLPLSYVALAVAYRDLFGLRSGDEGPVYAVCPDPYGPPPGAPQA